jgi:hypothetical protein
MIGIDPLDMAGAVQRLKSADMGAHQRLGIAADPVDSGSRSSRCSDGR